MRPFPRMLATSSIGLGLFFGGVWVGRRPQEPVVIESSSIMWRNTVAPSSLPETPANFRRVTRSVHDMKGRLLIEMTETWDGQKRLSSHVRIGCTTNNYLGLSVGGPVEDAFRHMIDIIENASYSRGDLSRK